jgi:hypothetical protein
MDKNIERIERYLEGIVPPEHESDQHRHQLRGQVLTGLERRHVMSVNPRTWKIAAAIAALVCTAAAATAVVGVKIHQYYFEGQGKDGEYFFRSERETVYEKTYQDANGVTEGVRVAGSSLTSFGADDANGMTVEQMQSDLAEIDLLRQQDMRELVGVTDMDVNGNAWRICTFKYVLADGRTRAMNEGDPDREKPASPEQMQKDLEEAARLRAQGVRDVVGVIDTEVEGQMHRTLECRYLLSDGRQCDMGEADPALTPPTKTLSEEQTDEIWRLKLLGQAQTLETVEQPVYGKTFVFERHLCTLADGTVATLAVGKVKGVKTDLTEADWKELRGLVDTNAGEFLSAYEQAVRGKLFAFERKRYTLADGTQVIRAEGKLKDGQ